MTRQELSENAINIVLKENILLELITGYGKSKIAIDMCNVLCKNANTNVKVLILVAKTVHKKTWTDEINKWGGLNAFIQLDIQCYESLHKYKNKEVDILVMDEVQHLSEKRRMILDSMHIHKIIGLSATIKKELKTYLTNKYNVKTITCGLKEAVKEDILPEPQVYLIPLKLNNTSYNYKIKKFRKEIRVTQQGYYNDISSLISWYKRKYFNTNNERIKNLWLSTAGKRLKWLSEQKEIIISKLLDNLISERIITFCSGIEQCERLGKFNITSKNKESIVNLTKFNKGAINHITACNILNEGVNLTNCRIGIFGNLNSSEIITKQRTGRLLRHESPIIIIPFFKDTREEELVDKILTEYTKESIHNSSLEEIITTLIK